ncbi:cullin-3-like isoform X1 [Adelges cooleyi]|uniref:cullin-3-like isoform X1 n=1 Tax=Adelges cooleyi TaxID=133065 RepID=UPI00217F68C1|nr:cullin-3-like isoform X1 [Adelges cooleyi]XP_050426294.1 cullin-3-like isoform X1 [Adelges cooleyi]XP_050426295.1 cullin-3-like isoform X1 [Adelges cooleyi]
MRTYLRRKQWKQFKKTVPKKKYKEILPILQKSVRRALQSDNCHIGKITFEEQAMYGASLTGSKIDRLWSVLEKEIVSHLEQKVRHDILKSFHSNQFLEILYACHQKYDNSMILITEMLWYVGRHEGDRWSNTFNDLAKHLFESLIISFIKSHLRTSLMHQVELLRMKNTSEEIEKDESIVKKISQMFIHLDFDGYNKLRNTFEEIFKKPLIEMVTESTKILSKQLLSRKCVSYYIRKAEEILIYETERADSYLYHTNKNELIESIENELIIRNMIQLVEMDTGVVFMITNNNKDDLACMYRLFDRVPDGLHVLCTWVSQTLRKLGRSLVEEEREVDTTNVVHLMKNLVDLKKKFFILLTKSFNNDKMFRREMNAAIDYIFNLNDNLHGVILNYFHDIMDMERPMSDNFELDKLILYLAKLRQERGSVLEKLYLDYLRKKLSGGNIFAPKYAVTIKREFFKQNFSDDFMLEFTKIVSLSWDDIAADGKDISIDCRKLEDL